MAAGRRTTIRTGLGALALALAWASASCTAAGDDTSDEPELDHAPFDARLLEGELLTDDPFIAQPADLAVSGEVLWVVDASGPFLHEIAVPSGELLRSSGRRGNGPGEFEGIPHALAASRLDDGAIWVYDDHLQRLTRVRPRRASSDEPGVSGVDARAPVLAAARLTPDTIAGVTDTGQMRIVFLDTLAHEVGSIAHAFPGDEAIPVRERRRAATNGFAVCGNGNGKMALAYMSAGRIEIYDHATREFVLANVPYPSGPNFEDDPAGGGPRWRPDRSWYVDCYATEDRLYALFSGRSTAAFEPEDRDHGRFVHVFAIGDGRLLRVVEVTPPLSDIAVVGGILYGASRSTGRIHRFRMPADQLPDTTGNVVAMR